MKFGFIATWKMSYDGMTKNIALLKKNDDKGHAIVNAISEVENYPFYTSVGTGGLPNIDGKVELDAAFMNGQNLSIGAVLDTTKIKNPIKVAHKLSNERFNSCLAADGAEKYASKNDFELTNNLLTKKSLEKYKQRLQTLKDNPNLSPYSGHDTVGMVSLSNGGKMYAGVSTSGLFMKQPGRIGDSAISGSGFYCNSDIGGATATGLGEDIMKGCLSYQTVLYMSHGLSPQKAAQKTIDEFSKILKTKSKKCGAMSIVALNKNGEFGVGTNVDFSFVAGNHEKDLKVYLAKIVNDKVVIEKASQEWINQYDERHS